MSAITDKGLEELRRFGWTLGPEFEKRYMEDAWVFNLVNALETVARERDEAKAALDRLVLMSAKLFHSPPLPSPEAP